MQLNIFYKNNQEAKIGCFMVLKLDGNSKHVAQV